MRHRPPSRTGWSLIELMIVMMFLTMFMALLGSVMWSVFRIQAAANASFEQLLAEANLADRFRDDVAAATDTPELAADFAASPLCLILGGDGDAIIMYRVIDDRVQRVELLAGDSRFELFRVAGENLQGEFGREGRLMTLTVRGQKRGVLTIAAALGGNRP